MMKSKVALLAGAMMTLLPPAVTGVFSSPTATTAGSTPYVSKLGDNSNGSSWAKAFTTLHAALEAIPDGTGDHRIIVRPDTYMEAMLSPAFKSAAGAYNELVGEVQGRYGSGRTGHVVIDAGDADKGFKSYDWWGPIRSNQQGWSPNTTTRPSRPSSGTAGSLGTCMSPAGMPVGFGT